MIRYGPEICGDLGEASRREWLETNGLGGFASSTITGMNTRRYHGLLTAALKPPSDRKVLLSKMEETLVVDGRRYELGCNQYPGAVHPQGHRLLREFRLDPFPVFVWRVEEIEISKSVFMIRGENGVVVQYRLSGAAADCTLELRPLIAFRDFHSTAHANPALNAFVAQEPGLATIQPYADLPRLHFAHDAREVRAEGCWYRNFQYERERERGLDDSEDLFQPFTMVFDLRGGAHTIVSTSVHRVEEAEGLGRAYERTFHGTGETDFLVERTGGRSVIAGYHWFGDWGRDTMISLPGLTLSTGKTDIARDILNAFALTISEGMLPNRFPDHGEQPEYNTVDATLWYFEAIRAWLAATGDMAFVKQNLLMKLREIVAWHREGTRYGIHVDSDGLLHAGAAGAQLTWMDAKVGDWVVTPRAGKPVEIQALWYNALRIMQDLTEQAEYAAMAAQAKQSFGEKFWNAEAGCLFDVVDETDGSIRPNQLAAFSLTHKILDDKEKCARVLSVVERELLTPYGLRTLAPSDARYRPHYTGDQTSRDGAYHQGTVWPWLLGLYCDACAYVRGTVDVRKLLGPLEEFRDARGVGQIPEIFDGDAPHEPRGCIAQAWSVAEVLRIKSRYGAT
jgi:glycogen debranching enzyme